MSHARSPSGFHPRATHRFAPLETVPTVPRAGFRMTYRFAIARLTQLVELAGSPAIHSREVGSVSEQTNWSWPRRPLRSRRRYFERAGQDHTPAWHAVRRAAALAGARTPRSLVVLRLPLLQHLQLSYAICSFPGHELRE